MENNGKEIILPFRASVNSLNINCVPMRDVEVDLWNKVIGCVPYLLVNVTL